MRLLILSLACMASQVLAGVGPNPAPTPSPKKFLPDSKPAADLPDTFDIFDNTKENSKIVANNKKAHVLFVAQKKDLQKEDINPFKVGELLSYIYEKIEWDPEDPPYGYTTKIFENVPDIPPIRRKRSNVPFQRVMMHWVKKNIKREVDDENGLKEDVKEEEEEAKKMKRDVEKEEEEKEDEQEE